MRVPGGLLGVSFVAALDMVCLGSALKRARFMRRLRDLLHFDF